MMGVESYGEEFEGDLPPDMADLDMDSDDDEGEEPKRKRGRPRKSDGRPLDRNDEDLKAYLDSIATDAPIKVTVVRKSPKVWGNRSIEGTLESHEEPISEEDLKEYYGGGRYRLIIFTQNHRGQWVVKTTRTISIAGDPKLSGMHLNGPTEVKPTTVVQEEPSVVRDTMKMASEMVRRAEERAERSQNGRLDPTTEMMLKSMQEEQRELRRQVAEKEDRLLTVLANKNDRSSTDTILEKMIDGENNRLTALRMQTESELRTMRESQKAEIERIHARYEDMAKRQEDAHKRELDMLVKSYESQKATYEMAVNSQIDGFRREIDHLARELNASKTELAETRAKKDKSVLESMSEIAAMREALDAFGGGPKEEDTGGTIERLVQGVLGSSLMEGIASRIASSPAPQPQPQAALEPPVNVPFQLPDGRTVMRRPDGSVVQIRKKEADSGEPAQDAIQKLPKINPSDLQTAVSFMETAYQNGTSPEMFGSTAKSVVPAPVISALRKLGPDAFLTDVAELSDSSPLMTISGKAWFKKVSDIVLD